MRFRKGDIVKLHNLGKMYTTYFEMADMLGCGDEYRAGYGNTDNDEVKLCDKIGTVVGGHVHMEEDDDSIVYGVRIPVEGDCVGTIVVLIGEEGIRKEIRFDEELFTV